MRWGLIPQWAKDTKTTYKMIIARGETLTLRPPFRSLLSRHCLAPGSGFCQWQQEEKGKMPCYA
jgi:putative SOS response-associated peptidase YedK